MPDFAAVLSAVTLAWQAAREQRLHLTRGGARKRGTGPAGPTRLSLDGHVLAACYRQHLGMPCRLIAEIPGVHESSISLATGRVAPLLEQHGITIAPARARISSLDALRSHAAAAASPSPAATAAHAPRKHVTGPRHAGNPRNYGTCPNAQNRSRSWSTSLKCRWLGRERRVIVAVSLLSAVGEGVEALRSAILRLFA